MAVLDRSELEASGFTFVKNIGDGLLPDWYQTSFQTPERLSSDAADCAVLQHIPQGHDGWQDVLLLRKDCTPVGVQVG